MSWLSILWFVLIAVLWIMFLILEGFDFGVGMLLRFVAKNDKERTTVLRTVGPHWDGNEVWLLTAGGATFAAMPEWYATMFSGMYLALFLVLCLLIVRICAFEWRAKIDSASWRNVWDWIHPIAGFGVTILLGCAFGNLVQGMKIQVLDANGGVIPPDLVTPEVLAQGSHQLTGGFFSLLTPYTLFAGIVLAALCLAHGAHFLALKTEDVLRSRAHAIAMKASIVAVVLAAILVIWGQFAYTGNLLAWIPLVIAALCLIAAAVFSQEHTQSEGWAFIFSSGALAFAVVWIFSAMAPNAMKSSIDPAYSMTIAQASSAEPTLIIMTIVAVIFVPIVLLYTAWSYWVFRNRVSIKDTPKVLGIPFGNIRAHENFLVG